MELYKQDGSKYWTADFFVNGRRVRKSTKQTTKAKAQEVAMQMMRQTTSGATPTRSLMPTLEQFGKETFLPFLDGCSLDPDTTRCYRNGYRLLKDTGYHTTPLDQVCYSDIDTLTVPGGPSNTNNMRRTISRMLSLAIDKRVLKSRPARIKMVKENRRTAVYSEEMEQKVLELAEQPLLDIFLLIFDGGIRPQESLSLEWSDLLWDKNLIHVRGTKSEGSYRHVPMSDRVKQALRVRAQGAKGRFVFPAKHKKDAPLSYVAIAKRFTRLREAAGIPDDLVLYSGRHTFATDLLDRTGNIKLVSEVLGHASVLTTERYLHPSKRGLAEHVNARNATRSRKGEIAACHSLRHSAAMVQ